MLDKILTAIGLIVILALVIVFGYLFFGLASDFIGAVETAPPWALAFLCIWLFARKKETSEKSKNENREFNTDEIQKKELIGQFKNQLEVYSTNKSKP